MQDSQGLTCEPSVCTLRYRLLCEPPMDHVVVVEPLHECINPKSRSRPSIYLLCGTVLQKKRKKRHVMHKDIDIFTTLRNGTGLARSRAQRTSRMRPSYDHDNEREQRGRGEQAAQQAERMRVGVERERARVRGEEAVVRSGSETTGSAASKPTSAETASSTSGWRVVTPLIPSSDSSK